MNTRLQVEHAVTEEISWTDLVSAQLALARGEPVGEPPTADLHAIEARLYAEDPAAGFSPCTGTVAAWSAPDTVRVDSGIGHGSVVGVDFDPMLAKIIGTGMDRAEARQVLIHGLERLIILGVRTNRDHLIATLAHPDFAAGAVHTSFLAEHEAELQTNIDLPLALVAAATEAWRAWTGQRCLLPGIVGGWRTVAWPPAPLHFAHAGEVHELRVTEGGCGIRVSGAGPDGKPGTVEVRLLEADGPRRALEIDGHVHKLAIATVGAHTWVQGPRWTAELQRVDDFPLPGQAEALGSTRAPMPGRVVAVHISSGERVAKGDALLVLEAMKMEQSITAPSDGVVADLSVAVGDQVEAGQILLRIEDPASQERGDGG
jgi:propionyl-CoA carboxylase alpha chain